jgi:exopolysaccharide biosynthesis protein
LTVTIQQATYTKSATGAEEPTWLNVATGVSAKVKYESADIEVVNGNRTSATTVRVYFAANQSLGSKNRILASDGAILKLISWDGFDEIEQLFAATCEVSKWPRS